jgi:hypothetical protein
MRKFTTNLALVILNASLVSDSMSIEVLPLHSTEGFGSLP